MKAAVQKIAAQVRALPEKELDEFLSRRAEYESGHADDWDKEIDGIVAEEADNPSAWEEPICVKKSKTASLAVPADLAARAAFLAHLHGLSGAEEWVARFIREQVELEEVAVSEAKRDLFAKRTRARSSHRKGNGHH